MEPKPFPKYVDAPKRILFWTVDQVVPVAVAFGIGLVLNQLMFFLLLGCVVSYFFTKYRDSRPDGYVMHMAYWYGVMVPKARSILSPFHHRIFPA